MYYRSVNRGILITVPGRYTIALVLGLGFIAIGSGYNSVYLALSVGIAILIVSGLLSEKVMKHYEVHGAERLEVDAESPFTLELKVSNRDPRHALYGVDNLVYDREPRFSWLKKDPTPLVQCQVLTLDPASTQLMGGTASGLRRGVYDHLFVVQRTLYPFGLLSKFKVSEFSTHLLALPKLDRELEKRLKKELEYLFLKSEQDREFYTHRQFQERESSKSIDWKRSAGRPTSEWVVKIFESRSPFRGVWIETAPDYLASSPTAKTYEEKLSFLRTAVDVVRDSNREVALSVGEKPDLSPQSALQALARLPQYSGLGTLPRNPPDETQIPSGFLRLRFTEGGHQWIE